MSSANGVIASPNLAFGWRANGSADGFEQNHGRFTVEVYWNGTKRQWGVYIWGNVVIEGKIESVILREGSDPDLNAAKKIGLRMATILEKEALTKQG